MGGMHRALLGAWIALVVAIPVGLIGAWAFNPDSGSVVHSDTLWHIFGIMAEVAIFLFMALAVLVVVAIVARKLLALGRSNGA